MLAIFFLLLALTAFFLIVFGQVAPGLADDVPVLTKPSAYTVGAQQTAGQTWFPLILAVVILGGELGSTVWATSLTRESSVLKHVLARLTVLTVASLIAFILGLGIWAVVAHFGAPGSGSPELATWLGFGWRLGLVALVWTSLGLAAVAMLRSVGPAIGVVLAFSFLESILALWDPYENVSATAASTGLFGSLIEGPFGEFIPGAGLSVPHAAVILAGWAILGLGLTWWGLHRRDA
jgi:hypothetical protein